MESTQKGDAANGGASALAGEGLLGVFEDRGIRAKDNSLEVQGVTEQHEADPLAMPRPKRRERFPTEYKAPSAVLTPLERELLMGSGTSSQPSAAEERPAGPMQPPRATVMEERPVGLVYPPQATANQEQPPNLMQPPRFAAAADRPAGVMQVQPPQAHVTLGHAFPTGTDGGKKRRRTIEDLCQEESQLRQCIAQDPNRRSSQAQPPDTMDLPLLGTYRPSQQQPVMAGKPAASQHRLGAPSNPLGAAPARPNTTTGEHGFIARKKPRRFLDDDDGPEAYAPPQEFGAGGRGPSPAQQAYQRYPGQQRGKEDGSLFSRKRKNMATIPPAAPQMAPLPPVPDRPCPPQHPSPPPPDRAVTNAVGGQSGGEGARAVTDRSQEDSLSPLHAEMLQFAALMTPGPEEQLLVAQCLEIVRASVERVWPHATTHVFGSQAVGLAMPGSDVDMCVMDAIETEDTHPKSAKQMQTAGLRQLKAQLNRDKAIDFKFPVTLIAAKVPIIKCHIRSPSGAGSLKTDISLNVGNGVKAVEGIVAHLQAMPPLRPLVLAAKALVKGHRLHEVHTGGISSFSLTNMAIAHLMAEGYHLPGQPPQQRGQQQVNQDLGHLLWGFLVRFGKVFDYPDQAVSIAQGGVIRKKPEWRVRFKAFLLAIEDPNVPGHDIASGTYQIQRVRDLFAESADKLTEAVERQMARGEAAQEQLAWDRIQADGQHRVDRPQQRFPILGSILALEC